MKLHYEFFKLVVQKFLLRQNTGVVLRKFCERMGVAYIKFAQILAMQNFGNLFSEDDRRMLSGICDDCNPISFEEIEKLLKKEYGEKLGEIFVEIEEEPVGSASISQVHKAKLKSGEVVAIKVKRNDVTEKLEKDIRKMRKFVHRYGRFVKFRNFVGGDKALDLYLNWIHQETDFVHERENILTYSKFAKETRGKVKNTWEIQVPKLFDELCTDNVIVMEFVSVPTVNKMELTEENKRRIMTGLNSYIRLSFWALFRGGNVVFHGDPHGGNIYLDSGVIGFLDMGLLFVLSDEDQRLIKQFFLAAYSQNSNKLYDLLIPYAKISEKRKLAFRVDLEEYCSEIRQKEITAFFTDMIIICMKYQFLPPDFLFRMAKAFVCLNGISGFTGNLTYAQDLLGEQVAEFLVERSLSDCKTLMKEGVKVLPEVMLETLDSGLAQGIAHGMKEFDEVRQGVKQALTNFDEALEVLYAVK